jgi:hypothetical protein
VGPLSREETTVEMTYRFRIKPGKMGAFVEWTKKQEADPPQAPEGWTYKGTYFVVQGFGDFDVEARWELTDYSALGPGDTGSQEWQESNKEFFAEFYDDRFPTQQALMKSADDVYVPEGF